MKNLLIKEFRMAASPLSYFFLAFSLMVFIPGYPILIAAFFVCLGIFYSFQSGREQNDTIYTALLPLPKCSLVQSKFVFTAAIEGIAFLLMTALTLLRMFAMGSAAVYLENPMMNANPVFLAGVLCIFALFNLVFLSGFFRTGYYFGKPFIFYTVIAMLFIGLAEVLHHIPGLEWLNIPGPERLGGQLFFLAGALVFWCLLTFLSYRISVRRFEMIDL